MTNNTVKLPKTLGLGMGENALLFTLINGVDYDEDFLDTVIRDCKSNGFVNFSIKTATALKKLGFKNIEESEHSYTATLPENWDVVYEDDYSFIIFDEKGRRRIRVVDDINEGLCGLIFVRYGIYVDGQSVYITGNEKTQLFKEVDEIEFVDNFFDESRDYFEGYLITCAYEHLKKEYPHWCNPFTYWD